MGSSCCEHMFYISLADHPLTLDHHPANTQTELMKEIISKSGVNVIDPYHLLNNVPNRKEKLMK